MSNGTSGKRLGFASFFADAKETSTDIIALNKNTHEDNLTPRSDPISRSLKHAQHQSSKKSSLSYSHKSTNGDFTRAQLKRSSSTKRNFKCIADPELDKTLPKGSKVVLRYGEESVRILYNDYFALELMRSRQNTSRYLILGNPEITPPKLSRVRRSIDPNFDNFSGHEMRIRLDQDRLLLYSSRSYLR